MMKKELVILFVSVSFTLFALPEEEIVTGEPLEIKALDVVELSGSPIVYQAAPLLPADFVSTPSLGQPKIEEPREEFWSPSLFLVDRFFSPEVGGEGMIPLLRALQRTEDRIFPNFAIPSTSWTSRGRRLLEASLIWTPLNIFTATVQHEVFGHGFRVRSFGKATVSVAHYHFDAPPPYGFGGGYTRYVYYPELLSKQDRIAITGAGVEGTALLARRLKLKWLQEGFINPREASLYQEAEHDLTRYIWVTVEKERKKYKMDGDIFEYVSEVNELYGSHLTVRGLSRKSWINFADPFTLFSFWGSLSYLWNGTALSIPMIPVGEARYLPGARLGLSPFGPEYYFENFWVKDHQPGYGYLRGGSLAKNQYWGAGFEQDSIWQWSDIHCGLRGDVWMQPRLNQINGQTVLGGAASLIASSPLTEQGSFYLQLGLKSAGYLPGEMLAKGWMGKIGLSINR